MTNSEFFAPLRAYAGRISISPRMAMVGIAVVVTTVIAAIYTTEFVVIVAGLFGAAIGYVQQKLAYSDNPVTTLKWHWGILRVYVMLCVSAFSILVALYLFLAGIGALNENADRTTFYIAAASGFYAYGMTYCLVGYQNLSRARRRISQANAVELHDWRKKDKESERPSLAASLLRQLSRVSEPSQLYRRFFR
jgi:hypothetical protein